MGLRPTWCIKTCALLTLLTMVGEVRAADTGPANVVSEALSTSLERLEQFRKRLHGWDRSVRGFRREHNFALTSGPASGRWHLYRLGDRKDHEVESNSVHAKFQYTFHLQLMRGFGYFLGSSIGGLVHESMEKDPLRIRTSISLPGVVFGLVYNLSPAFRITTGVDAHLQRIEGFGYPKDGERALVNITARTVTVEGAADFFYNLGTALRVEVAVTRTTFSPPSGDEGQELNAKFLKEESYVGIGLLYHLI